MRIIYNSGFMIDTISFIKIQKIKKKKKIKYKKFNFFIIKKKKNK